MVQTEKKCEAKQHKFAFNKVDWKQLNIYLQKNSFLLQQH